MNTTTEEATLEPLYRTGCGEHAGLCAYDGYEPTRCPYCHATWRGIERSGWHTCEKRKVWHRGTKAGAAEHAGAKADHARQMRVVAQSA